MPGRVTLAPEAVLAHRLRAHHLDRRLPAGETLSAAGACGVQNSPPGAWETALWARCADVSREGLRRLLEEERVLLQAWSIRGVPLVFPAAEAGAFLSALLPAPGEETWIYTRGIGLATDCLGMSQEELLPLVLSAAEALQEVTVTGKEELDRFLAGRVRPLLPAGVQERWDAPSMYGRPDRQTVGMAAVSFLLRPCAFAGRVVFGRREGTSPTFTAPERWLGAPLPTDPDGGRKLVKKFLHCYGPATPAMFGSWLGCSPFQAKRLWQTAADELLPAACDGRRGWVLEADREDYTGEPEPRALLLGAHDPYLDLRDRERILPDTGQQRTVWQTVANPGVLLSGGRVAGIWRSRTTGRRTAFTFTAFRPLSTEERAAFCREAEALAAFRGSEAGTIDWEEGA